MNASQTAPLGKAEGSLSNPQPAAQCKFVNFIKSLRKGCTDPFLFSSSANITMSVLYVWAKTVLRLPVWPREARQADTPVLEGT